MSLVAIASAAACASPRVPTRPLAQPAEATPSIVAPVSAGDSAVRRPAVDIPASGTTIPLAVDAEQLLLVPVMIEGKPFRFLLDTGATATSIAPRVRSQLGLVIDPARVSTVTNGSSTIDGIPSVTIERFAIGEVELRDVDATVLPDDTADGAIGMDVLSQMVAELDLRHDALILYPAGSTSWHTDELVAVRYTSPIGGLLEVDAAFGVVQATAIVDSGTSTSIANSHAAPHPTDIPTGVRGSDGRVVPARVQGSFAIEVSGVSLGDQYLYVANLPLFATLGIAARPAVVLGLDRLRGHRVVIDASVKTLYFSK